MDKFIRYVRRFNTIVIGIGLLFLLGLATMGGIEVGKGFFRSEKKGVEVPQAQGQGEDRKESFVLRPTDFTSQAGNPVFKLMTEDDGGRSYEEGRGIHVRNLLFFKSESEKSKWLFQDQSLLLNRIESLKNGIESEILYIEAEPVKHKNQGENKRDSRSVYLVRMDGGGLEKVLGNLEQTLRHRVVQNQVEIIYQSAEAVRLAKFSLKDFKKVSDIEVARIAQ